MEDPPDRMGNKSQTQRVVRGLLRCSYVDVQFVEIHTLMGTFHVCYIKSKQTKN